MDIKETNYSKIDFSTRHPWELARLEVIYSIIKRTFLDIHYKPLSILDLGCGDAYISYKLSKKIALATFYAIDNAFTKEIIAELDNILSNPKINLSDSIEKIQLSGNKQFDLILILDVLEHVDDILLMKNLKNHPSVGEQTLFLITVPAFQILFCSRDFFLGHKRRYTNTLLKYNLNEAGFKVLKMNYFFSLLLVPRLIRVLMEKITKPSYEDDGGIGKWKTGNFINIFFKYILILDFKISQLLYRFKIKIPGLSNYALCQIHV